MNASLAQVGQATSPVPNAVNADEREALIREAAYFVYQNNGCRPGHALSDWLAAESAFDARAAATKTATRSQTKKP